MPSWYKMQDNSTPRKASSGIDLRNVSFTHLSSRESHNHVLQYVHHARSFASRAGSTTRFAMSPPQSHAAAPIGQYFLSQPMKSSCDIGTFTMAIY